MEQAARAAGIADIGAGNAAAPARNVEMGAAPSHKRSSSRVSLPLSHRRSFSSVARSRATSIAAGKDRHIGTETSQDAIASVAGDDEDDEEVLWGPSHPCFPHLNPHVPKSSPFYESSRIIRIKRDWLIAGDLAPTFENIYPEILEPLLAEDKFHEFIEHVNRTLMGVFNPYRKRNWLDVSLGALTGWIWDDLGLSQVKKDLAALETWIETWSKEHEHGHNGELQIIPLRQTGFLSIDIQIPDPKLDLDADESASLADTEPRRSTRRSGTYRSTSIGRSASISSSRVGQTARLRDEDDQTPEPVVPPIPGKYLDQVSDSNALPITYGSSPAAGSTAMS